MSDFPRTTVGGVSLSRMIIGTNWLFGYSHTSHAADMFILDTHKDEASLISILEAYLSYGVDTILGGIIPNKLMMGAIKRVQDSTGKKIYIIDSSPLNIDDTQSARKEAFERIKQSKEQGATVFQLSHGTVEKLLNRQTETIDRLSDYLYMIRENGLIPGLSAHMPEVVVYTDQNEYDVETYIQIYNCMGFLMQVEIEYIHKVIWDAKKPVITIKPMAAGRCSPLVGLTFNFASIRPCDMVCVGAFTPLEVHEDVEISLAAIERRRPDIEGRATPTPNSLVSGSH